MVKKDNLTRFDNEQTPQGARWAANHPVYARWCKPPGARILVRGGGLRKSIRTTFSRSGPVYSVAVSSNLKYSRSQYFGFTRKNISIPFWGNTGRSLFFKNITVPPRHYIGHSLSDARFYVGRIWRYLTNIR